LLLDFPTRQYLLHRVFIRGRFRNPFISKVQQAYPLGRTFRPCYNAVLCPLRAEHSTLVGFGIDHAFNQRSSSLSVYGDPTSFSHLYIQAGKYFVGIVFYFCYRLWRHNGEYFSIWLILSLRPTGFEVDTERVSYFSASSEQFIQHIVQHGQVQCVCLVVMKADSRLLGRTYGLVSLTTTCALHVPARRASLLESYSGAFRLILTRRASLTIATTVILPCHRKMFTVSRR
jgi:hypothetical protein